MNFAFSEDQDALRETVRKFLEAKSPSAEVRRLMETTEGYDDAVWKQMGQELGLQSLHIPEAYGGQGYTFVELGIVFEEMGRVLLCAPYFSTVALAANAILNAGSDEAEGGAAPRHRRGGDDRHRRVHRGQRPVGRRGYHDASPGRRRRLRARRPQDVRARRPYREHDHRRGASRRNRG